MDDIAYYRWLDSPFTLEEQATLARIERQHKLVQELYDQVAAAVGQLRAFYSAWPRRRWSIYRLDKLTPKTSRRALGITFRLDPSRFILAPGESEYWPELVEKQNRPAFLSQFRYNPDEKNGFIARLEREMLPEGDIKKYLNTELDLFNRNHAAFLKSFEPDEEGRDRRPADRRRHYLMLESREARAKEFCQHITAEIARLGGADTPPQDATVLTRNKRVGAGSKSLPAELAPGIEPAEVRTLLHSLGMGTTFNKAGEWAAALRGLYLGKVLKGSAPAEMARWAISQGYILERNKEAIRIPWKEEWYEPGQVENKVHRMIFKEVKEKAVELLESKKKTSSNN